MPSGRTAARLIHANATTSMGRKAMLWGAITVAALALWIGPGEANVRSLLFLFVGLFALAAWEAGYKWYRMRRFDPESIPEAERIARGKSAQLEARRLRERLAAWPPRFTYALLVCILVPSALEMVSHGRWVDAAGLVKDQVRAGAWWRLLTSTYLHGGLMHLWFNAGALLALGRITEAYAPRLRLPLVYLSAALGGGLFSTLLMPRTSSIGASGAIMGVAGYLFILARRQRSDVPPALARSMTITFGMTAYIGLFGFAFIDNACHVGGTLTGMLAGHLTIPRGGATAPSAQFTRRLDQAGWLAAIVLVAGAFATSVLLWRAR